MRNVLQFLEKVVCSKFNTNTIVDGREEISYIQLLENAQKVGAALLDYYFFQNNTKIENSFQALYEPPRKPVLVVMDKGINALSAFMGIVYAGCFYVLINPDLPEERIKKILSITSPQVLITDRQYFDKVFSIENTKKILLIEELRNHTISLKEKEMLEIIRDNMIDTDPLYANFTSGSTGIPKGVLVSHRSVIDFINQYTKIFQITENDIIGNQAPFDFDVSVKDIYSAFKTGAKLVIIEKSLFSKPTELLDYICDNQITVMTWAVSALCLVTTFHALDYRVPKTVKKVLFSGEVMPIKHLQEWMKHLPETMFVNLYGPTEITCNCTYHIISRERNYEKGIPLGKAFPNERVFLLNENNQRIYPNQNIYIKKDKTIGEICVAGTALALGYYNDPEETQKAFVINPDVYLFEERIYRTGDLAYYDENQDLIFAGRKDFQIKHMGHRIELEEIEQAMMLIDGIERSCCVFDQKRDRLVGFYVGKYESKELHKQLTAKLPSFMVPGALKPLKEMPITKNGKIDRKLLLILATERKAYKEYIENFNGISRK